MSGNTPESDVVGQLRAKMNQGNLGDVTITYRVAGGMPADNRIEEELTLSGAGVATARVVRSAAAPQRASSAIDPAEFETVLRQIERDVGKLIPRTEARFLPDSTVGSITIGVGDEKATYFFLVDEEQPQARTLAEPPAEADAVSTLDGLLRRIIGEQGE